MAKYSRLQILQKMQEQSMVPLFYHGDIEIAKNVLKACFAGGARLLEFTNRGDFAHEVFGELNKFALKELPGMMLGIGSVTDAATASLYMQLGANFIVTPSLKEDIAIVCNRRKIPYMPGCGSLTEISKAEELGCEVVKLFPGNVYGPQFIKSVKAPQPWTHIMPTGGVSCDKDNLSNWFEAGAFCVGIGSKLISKKMIDDRDFNGIERKVKETLELIDSIRILK